MLRNVEKFHMKMTRKKVGRAINRYSMIRAGDRVLVAMSGGKDSLALLDIIAARLKYLPISYEIIAAHIIIDSLPPKLDAGALADFCAERGIPLYFKHISVDFDRTEGKSVCFYCSWHRRKELFRMMNELHCTRLAFGHHMDDIVETLIMNMAIHGKFSTMPPKLSLFGGEFDIIRPLCLITEQEVLQYSKLRGISVYEKSCPHGVTSIRAEAKRIVKSMGNLSAKARSNIYRSMFTIENEYLAAESYDEMVDK